jgi:hypothetical protein
VRNSVSACLWFLQGSAIPGFPHSAAEFLHPCTGYFSSMFCFFPAGRREIFHPCIWLPVLSKVGANSYPAVLEYVVPSQTVCCTHLAVLQISWPTAENSSATGQCRQAADRGLVFVCVWWVPVFPDACSSLHVVFCVALLLARLETQWGGEKAAQADGSLRFSVWGSVSTLILAGPGIPRCPQVSVFLCIVF